MSRYSVHVCDICGHKAEAIPGSITTIDHTWGQVFVERLVDVGTNKVALMEVCPRCLGKFKETEEQLRKGNL